MQVQRFSFRDFSESVIAVKSDVPPPPPVFNEEEIKTAEREAYKKGFLEGTDEGRKQAESEQAATDRQLTAALEQCVRAVETVSAEYAVLAKNLQEQMPKIALAIARKVAGAALEQNAQAVVEDMAMRCLGAITGEPKFTVTLHESLGDALEKRLKDAAANLPSAAAVTVMRKPDMPVADCRIEWERGAMERQTNQLWEQVEKIIAEMSQFAGKEKPAEAAPPTEPLTKE